MLIAFVLLGRNLEQRAKIKATSDMTGLLSILPSKARLVVNDGTGNSNPTVEVSSFSLNVGDQILVLPGVRNWTDLLLLYAVSSVIVFSSVLSLTLGFQFDIHALPLLQTTSYALHLLNRITIWKNTMLDIYCIHFALQTLT